MTLIDVGCGEGFISNYIYMNTNIKKITAVDINKESIEYAKKQNNNINYINKDIRKLKYSQNEFDIVICLEVLEHLKYHKEVLKKINSIFKKRLIITIPYEPYFSLGNFLFFKNVKTFGKPQEHVNFWNKKSIRKYLIENNINNFKIETSFPWIIIIIEK